MGKEDACVLRESFDPLRNVAGRAQGEFYGRVFIKHKSNRSPGGGRLG